MQLLPFPPLPLVGKPEAFSSSAFAACLALWSKLSFTARSVDTVPHAQLGRAFFFSFNFFFLSCFLFLSAASFSSITSMHECCQLRHITSEPDMRFRLFFSSRQDLKLQLLPLLQLCVSLHRPRARSICACPQHSSSTTRWYLGRFCFFSRCLGLSSHILNAPASSSRRNC